MPHNELRILAAHQPRQYPGIGLMWHDRVTERPDTPHLKFLRIKEMARLLILLVSFGFYA